MLSDNPQIVQIRFHTVIRTSAHCDLEFVREQHLPVSFIKSFMDLSGKLKRIQKSILTGRSFAGNNRTYFGTGSSCHQPFLRNKLLEFLDFVIRNARYFHRQTGGKDHLAVSEFFRCLCNTSLLSRRDLAVYGDDTPVEVIRSLVVQKAHAFDSLLICCAYC